MEQSVDQYTEREAAANAFRFRQEFRQDRINIKRKQIIQDLEMIDVLLLEIKLVLDCTDKYELKITNPDNLDELD